MTDKKHYKFVEQFANEHSIAIGGKISVTFEPHVCWFKPKDNPSTMKYEDVCYLSEQISGASSFVFWLRRNGYEIRRRHGKKNQTYKM